MRIDRLEPIPGPTGRIRVVFDGAQSMKVYPEVVADCGLYAGKDLTEEELDELRKVAARASARQRAVRIVSASTVSERELKRRLQQKGEDPEQAQQAVEWLKDLNVIDDAEAARQIVRRAAGKGYGAARAKQELYAKGVAREYWDAALADYPDMSEAIDRFIAQRLRGEKPDQKQLKQLTDALYRRGHSWEDIRAGLRRADAEE